MGKVRALPGAWYGANTPTGSFAALYPTGRPDPHIETSHGRVELPGQNVLFLDCADVGDVLCLAGAVKIGDADTAILWDGQEWIPLCPAYGTSPVAFGPDGTLYVSSIGAVNNVRMFSPTGASIGAFTQQIGSRGIASVDERGVHPVDQWYGKFGLGEYVEVGGYRIGQGTTSRDGLVAAGYGPLIPDGLCQFTRVRLRDGQFAIATWRPMEGQLMLLWLTVDELEAMRPLVVEVPAIGRPLWLGGFMFDGAPAPMGNCTLAVRNVSGPQQLPVIVTDETVDRVSGTILGHFISGSTVEDIEARAAQLQQRPVAYWDSRRWPRYPSLPPHAWLCLQAYCLRDEPPDAFEADMRAVLATVPAGVDVALVAQCYTSNANLTPDIAALVPVFARLCQDARVVALLPFSFSGRATGLQDHPEAAVTWQSLAAGIAGTPPIPPMEPPMKKCEVTVDAFNLTPGAKLPDGVAFEIHDRENPHGAIVRGWVEGGSMRFSIDYQGLTGVKGETAARRPVR